MWVDETGSGSKRQNRIRKLRYGYHAALDVDMAINKSWGKIFSKRIKNDGLRSDRMICFSDERYSIFLDSNVHPLEKFTFTKLPFLITRSAFSLPRAVATSDFVMSNRFVR